jgi:hypothetical protein
MAGILPQIRHIVAVMLENRSFDNMCGWLYRQAPPPSLYLPKGIRIGNRLEPSRRRAISESGL